MVLLYYSHTRLSWAKRLPFNSFSRQGVAHKDKAAISRGPLEARKQSQASSGLLLFSWPEASVAAWWHRWHCCDIPPSPSHARICSKPHGPTASGLQAGSNPEAAKTFNRVRSLTCHATGLQEHELEREGKKTLLEKGWNLQEWLFSQQQKHQIPAFSGEKKSEIINYHTPRSEKKTCTIPEGILIPPDIHNRN